MTHILAIDDDGQIRALLSDYLTEAGFHVSLAADGATALDVFEKEDIDLILLDIVLPDTDGITLAARIRAISKVPIIMLTQKNDEVERVVGLEVGADDYVAKPFSPRELLARIKSLLRRIDLTRETLQSDDNLNVVVSFADWSFDMTARILNHADGRTVQLTNSEFQLLSAFIERPRRVLSRDQLLEFSRADPDAVFDRSIDYLVLRLRRKIENDPHKPEILKTEHGAGYIFAQAIVRR